MVRAAFVTYLFALSISSTIGSLNDCAIGPEYWCKSFENAQDCGAIQHCTDTVWSTDEKYTKVKSTVTCQICQKIFMKTHEGLGENEDFVKPNLLKACDLLPSDNFRSKCTKIVNDYGSSIISLMKKQRFATICHLVDGCTKENKPSAVVVGQSRCTWGPSYWCSSLRNSRDCQATEHCLNQIWSQQTIQTKNGDNVCQYCINIINKLNTIITDSKIKVDAKTWLDDMCNTLPGKDAIDQCKQLANEYTEEIVDLLKNTIDPSVICHLGSMCEDVTVTSRDTKITEQSRMLCNSIVRATHDLYRNEQKSQSEIEEYLKNDCQQMTTDELKQKCIDMVENYGSSIFGNVVDDTKLSAICDKTVFESLFDTRCDQCQSVISSANIMLNNEHSKDEVLQHIDDKLCSRLDGIQKLNCQTMLDTYRDILLNDIRLGKQSNVICSYFQLCFHKVPFTQEVDIMKTDPLFYRNFCDRLGVFLQICHALIERNSTALINGLVNHIGGEHLCHVFGMCPENMPFLVRLSIQDDTNKCKRCINDFSRRKHIAEKLLNHSAQFLEHLCGQIPQKDQCLQSIDESITKLRAFIQSLNPHDICQELKLCNQTLIESIEIMPMFNELSDQVTDYTLKEICVQSGPLSALCHHIVEHDNIHLLYWISKSVDPHQVCSIIDICPKTNAFTNCNDKCECCISKVENYQTELTAFLYSMVISAQNLCNYMPYSIECQQVVDGFKKDVEDILSSFNPRQICQMFTHCSELSVSQSPDKCQICQTNLVNRQTNFREILLDLSATIQQSCPDEFCRVRIQLKYQTFINQLNKISLLSICQSLGSCPIDESEQSLPYFDDLSIKINSDFDSAIQDQSDTICEKFGSIKPICQQLLASKDNLQLYKTYKVFFNFDFEIINEDLQEGVSTSCDQCKYAVQQKKDQWLNSLKTVRNILLQGCEKCPSKDQCRAYVNERFDNLTTYVKQIDPQQICENLHFCSNLIAIDSCLTCIERVNLQQQAVLQGIDRLAGYFIDDCQHIANKECQIFVKEIKDSLQELINSFDTKDMCKEIGFCDQSNPLDFNDYEKSIENKINKGICSSLGQFQTLCQHILHGNLDEIQHLQLRSESNDLEQFESGDKCKYCIARVQRRKYRMKFIGDSIFRILIHSCHRRQQCRRAYRLAKARFDARIRRICPYLVCKRFGYCIKPNSTKIQSTIDRTNSTCILCEYVMNYLSNYIHLNSTEEEIEENLEQICDQLPTILQNQCQEYIDDYSPTIISILLNDFNLTTICQKLNLCSNQITNNINHLIKADTTTCGICDYLSTYIYFERQRHSNNNYLSTVCSHLSDEYQTKCQIILQLFSPFINELELSPKKNFCKQLPICEIPMVDLKDAELINEQSNALPKCTICQYVISYLDAALRNNKSQQAIEEALEQVCTILPKVERDQCTQLLKTYGPVIAQLIVDSADPDMICRRVGLCQQSTNDNSKCTLGREYWCANRENAELCDAVDFCEREVWNVVKPLFY